MFFQLTSQANQKVFVSPGVYTSETDLSFVAQSVGVTTLGIVGETLKGPAFEPIFITNYDEFQTFFGGTVPTKFIGTQIPKYEAAYIAKAYLQQSNQLFVTRILGLSGYDAGPSWSLQAVANVDSAFIGIDTSIATVSFTANFSGFTTGNTVSFGSGLPALLANNLSTSYTLIDGSTSTYSKDVYNFATDIIAANSVSGNTAVGYGSIPTTDYNNLTLTYPNVTNEFGCDNLSLSFADLSNGNNDPWYYATFDPTTGNTYSGYSWYYSVTDFFTAATPSVTNNYFFSGTVTGQLYTYSGQAYYDWNNLILATVRSRGISIYDANDHGPQYQVTGLTDLNLVCTGPYSGISQSPFATFLLSGTTYQGNPFSFEASFDSTNSNYITKVLGVTNFAKPRTDVPIYVEESYLGLLNYGFNKGYVRGVKCDLIALPEARDKTSTTSIAWFLDQYQTPKTPFLVSELRGNVVYNLFRFMTISDGNSANTEVKISIANISFSNLTFDVLVRDFFDTDANPVVYEKFTNCTMDPTSNSFVAKKIGSSDGEYPLNSAYVMVELSDEYPVDALPCGFYGLEERVYESTANPSPFPIIKNKYFFPGETIFDPPFGTSAGGSNITSSSGDIVRRTYLGISSQFGIDTDLLQYKGKKNPVVGWDLATTSEPWNYQTKGFHMDSGATIIQIANSQITSGTPAFVCGVANFSDEPTDQANPYYFLYSRKFTTVFQGGFDGWDIYREFRTNQDRFALGASGYLQGATPTQRYPTASGDGTFKRIVIGDNTQDFANTDYYAYLLGQLAFANPESTNINVFATPGIDYVNNSNLCELAIGMVENERADAVYIVTSPDYNMYTPDGGSQYEIIYPQEAVDNLDQTGIDSSYTATYYPWILERDTVNNTQLYIPPTGQVCRNLALTDNISFPWFASAGYTRGLVNSVKARLKLTQEDRDTLYQGRINPIATFSDVGTVIWGNKTLQIRDSALNRLNVRRLLLQARKLISAVAVRLLFEQNDEIVRQQFLDSVNPILDAIRRDRGLYDFRVTVSSTPEDLDRNTLTGKIYLKPTKALEFIDIEFLITPTGASFENI
jgi:hypothetical protein